MIAVTAAPVTGAAPSPTPVPAVEETPIAGPSVEGDQPSFGSVLARETVGDKDGSMSVGGARDRSHKAEDPKQEKDQDTAVPSPLALYTLTLSATAPTQAAALSLHPSDRDGSAGNGEAAGDTARADGLKAVDASFHIPLDSRGLPAGLNLVTALPVDHNGGLQATSDTAGDGTMLSRGAIAVGVAPRGELSAPANPPPGGVVDPAVSLATDEATRPEHGKTVPPPVITLMGATIPGLDRSEKTFGSNRGEDSIVASLVRPDPGKGKAVADPALSAPPASLAGDPAQAASHLMSSTLSGLPAGEVRPGGANQNDQQSPRIRVTDAVDGTSNQVIRPLAVTEPASIVVPTAQTTATARPNDAHAGGYATATAALQAAASIVGAGGPRISLTVPAQNSGDGSGPASPTTRQPVSVPKQTSAPALASVSVRTNPVSASSASSPSAASLSSSDKDRHADTTGPAHTGDAGTVQNWPALPTVHAAPSGPQPPGGPAAPNPRAGEAVFQPIAQGVLVHGASLHVVGATSSFNVVLTPPSLGMVTVHVAHGQEGLQVTITPHQSDTTALLNQHLPDLLGMLKQGGQDLPVQAQIVQTHSATAPHDGTPQAAGAGQSGLNFSANGGGQTFTGQQGSTDQRAWAATANDLFGRPDRGSTANAPTAGVVPARAPIMARIDLHA